jgi:hypothetical protein
MPICVTCPLNCQKCSTNSICLVCNTGYYLTANGKCKLCSSSCQFCLYNSTNCTMCPAGSYFFNQACFECINTIPFCETCTINSNSTLNCINCTKGMYSIGSVCRSCSKNCATCVNSTVCSIC